jgi:hypothetical protein
MAALTYSEKFYGWRIVGAAFVLAVFGWGLGFYGPPIYLQAVRDIRGWSLPLVSAAVTVHFLFGALIVASLPKLYLRYGLPAVTKAGAWRRGSCERGPRRLRWLTTAQVSAAWYSRRSGSRPSACGASRPQQRSSARS